MNMTTIKKVGMGLKKFDKAMDKFLKKATMGAVSLLVFTGIVCGYQNIATNAYSEITLNSGEDVLLQKGKVVNDIVVCKEGLNGYQASSKTVCLSDGFSNEKLQKLVDRGYTIYIGDDQANANLPEPVKVNGKTIVVSIHSLDDDLVQTVNKLVS